MNKKGFLQKLSPAIIILLFYDHILVEKNPNNVHFFSFTRMVDNIFHLIESSSLWTVEGAV